MQEHSKAVSTSKHLWHMFKEAEKKLDHTMDQLQTLISERKKNVEEIKKLKKRIKSDSGSAVESMGFISSSIIKKDGSYSVKVSKLARALCEEMDLSAEKVLRADIIARLHLTGLLFAENNEDEFFLYPEKSLFLIEKFSGLKKIAPSFLELDEKFDGSGPLSKKGKKVSMETRIVRSAAYYYFLYSKDKTANEIAVLLDSKSGNSLDPNVVSVLYRILVRKDFFSNSNVINIGIKDLEPGMNLVSGIFSTRGAMLLPSGTVMNKEFIQKIVSYNEGEAVVNTILIRR